MTRRVVQMQISVFTVCSTLCILVLSVVTCFNSYRIFTLEEELQDLTLRVIKNVATSNVMKENTMKRINKYISERAIRSLESSNLVERKSENLSRHRRHDFEGISSSGSDSYSSSNTVLPNQKGDSGKLRHIVKKAALRSIDSGTFSSNDFDTETIDSELINQNEDIMTRRPRARMLNLDERHPRTGRIKPLPSIHLSGDTSRYVLGTHDNFNGNGHLRHLQDVFVDWKPNSWVEKTGMLSHFGFEDGYLIIKESGLYFIYAQIYYLDQHDRNGYIVYKNKNPILQCTIELHTSSRIEKGNTCYTAGVEYIAEGDKLSLKDIVGGHYSLFEVGKSFFGVIKLGDVRTRI